MILFHRYEYNVQTILMKEFIMNKNFRNMQNWRQIIVNLLFLIFCSIDQKEYKPPSSLILFKIVINLQNLKKWEGTEILRATITL